MQNPLFPESLGPSTPSVWNDRRKGFTVPETIDFMIKIDIKIIVQCQIGFWYNI